MHYPCGLPVGLYRLTQDVENPRGDRRCSHQTWRKPFWKKGAQFFLGDLTALGFVVTPGARYLCPASNCTDLLSLHVNNADVLDQLVPHLEPVVRDLTNVLQVAEIQYQIAAKGILAYLVQSGKISLEDVEQTITEIARPKELL